MLCKISLFLLLICSVISQDEEQTNKRNRRYSYHHQQPFPAFSVNSPMSMSYPGAGPGSPITSLEEECITGEIVCPDYCLMEDEWGCRYCPCGPANGMSPPVVGYDSRVEVEPHHNDECLGTILCMLSCKDSYRLGPKRETGCQTCSCVKKDTENYSLRNMTMTVQSNSSHSTSSSSSEGCQWPLCMGGTQPNGGPGAGSAMSSLPIGGMGEKPGGIGGSLPGVDCMGPACSAKNGMHSVSGSGGPAIPQTHSPILTPAPPHPEPLVPGCPDNTHCKTDCKYGYQLGPLRGDGCRLCFCNEPPTRAPEIIHIVNVPMTSRQPCVEVDHCRMTCQHGFEVYNSRGQPCPGCRCILPSVVVAPARPQETINILQLCPEAVHCMETCTTGYTLTSVDNDRCPACNCHREPQVLLLCTQPLSCPRGCSVGYRCDTEGCPTCNCVHPTETALEIHVETVTTAAALDCSSRFSCVNKCSLGYRAGHNDCPICECLQPVLVQPAITPQLQPVLNPAQDCLGPECSAIHSLPADLKRPDLSPASRPATIVTDYVDPSGFELNLSNLDFIKPIVLPTPSSSSCTQPLKCPLGCNLGYRCDSIGCPTCTCILPSETKFYSNVQSVIVHEVLDCQKPLSCETTCTFAYKTGGDTCPICTCLEPSPELQHRPAPLTTEQTATVSQVPLEPIHYTQPKELVTMATPAVVQVFQHPVTQMPLPLFPAPSGIGCLGPECPSIHQLGVSGNTFFEAVENSQHLPDKRPLISQAQTVQSTMKTTVTGSPNTESEQPSGVSSDRGGPTSGKNSTRHSGQINIAHTPNGVYTEHSQPNPIVVNSGIMPTVLSGVKQQTTTVEQLNTWMTVLPEVHESTAPPDTASPLTEVLGVEATTTKRQDIQNNSLPIPLATPDVTPGPLYIQEKCAETVRCMLQCPASYNLTRKQGSLCPNCSCVDLDCPGPHCKEPTTASVEPRSTPPPGQCVAILHCVMTCTAGYDVGEYGSDGCPSCTCLD